MEAFARLFGVTDYLDKFLETPVDEADLSRGHTRPRSYNLRPFDIDFEVNGSVRVIESLCPPGKKVRLMQWSGSTFPFEKFLKAVRKAGLRNINGGDTRLDDEFPSYAWVMGLSRQVGQERQIYSSASNENTYTNKWSNRYFGFRYWKKTIDNTGAPRRVKPVDLYYHMFTGERVASLNALIENLNYARTLELTPITASYYASIADGFFSTQIEELNPQVNPGVWQISSRDGLNTFRFDQTGICVDYDRSQGILGSRIANGSLYIAIDPAVAVAVLATSKGQCNSRLPFLIESRWPVEKLQRTEDSFRFAAQGFGKGQMSWHVRPQSKWVIEVSGSPKRMFYSSSGVGGWHIAPRVRRTRSRSTSGECESPAMMRFHYLFFALVAVGGLGATWLLLPSKTETGLMHLKEKHLDTARATFEDLLNKGDYSVDVAMPLVDIYLQYGETDKAIRLLEKFSDRGNSSPEVITKLAQVNRAAVRLPEYMHALETLAQAQQNPETLRQLEPVYRYFDRRDSLARMLEWLAQSGKATDAELAELAQIKASAGDPASAMETLKKLDQLKRGKLDRTSLELWVRLLIDTGKQDEAFRRAQTYTKAHPDAESIRYFSSVFARRGLPRLGLDVLQQHPDLRVTPNI